MLDKTDVLCIGEILWDGLPSGLYLGGAPLNVCYHLNQFNLDATIASKVGNDRLGKEAIQRVTQMGISADLIQMDAKHETGFVKVKLSESGDPEYDIIKPVAWDFLEPTDILENTAKDCWGLVFGSLAQRTSKSRETIQSLWDIEMNKILDMNLREPHFDQDIIHDLLNVADIVKMNEDELNQIKDWYGFSGESRKAIEQLSQKFECSLICVTRGANGAVLLKDGAWFEHKGFPTKVKDAVGAGDAFLAALLYGLSKKHRGNELLALANATGALVAQKDGATPGYSIQAILDEI